MSREQRINNTNGIEHGHKRDVISRVSFLYLAFMIVGALIAMRLVWVQMVSPAVKHNAAVLQDGVFRIREIAAHRGAILTHDGEPLAISSLRYNVEMDFKSEGIREAKDDIYAKNVDSLSKLLAMHFSVEDAQENNYKHITAEGYRKIFHEQRAKGRNRAYKLFPRLVTIDEWNTLRNYPILNGNLGYVYFTRAEDKRIYPLGDVARQVIGRHTALKDKDDKEIKGTGIEYFFDEHLKGHNGSVKEQWIAHGFWARVEEEDNQLPENGCNIITTIDAGIQRVADEQLRKVLQEQNASFGVAIVMEVETGNILAMANLGSGRERGNEYSERVENHALRSRMMPGSTMKLATTMALLEIGGYNLDTKVNTEHSRPNHGVKVGAAKIEDSHDAAGKDSDGNVTLKDAFAHSSNVYFAKAIYETFKSNPKEYTDFLAKLRFNDYIGLEKYGEVQGDLTMADSPKWNTKGSTSSRLPRLAYGYEMDVPPIHMLTFYNGVANEGRMVAPRIVDRIERDGEVIEKMPVVTLINRMCSKKTLAALDTCLAAASERTGRYFRDLAIPFGCKTGTAQMWSTFVSESRIDKHQMKDGINGKQDNYYYGSIICTMPQENPKYTIMVGVCKQATPDSPSYFGIDLSAPVAADIMEYIYANDHTLHSAVEKAEEPHTPETIKGGKTKHVAKIGALTNDVDNESDGASWSQATVEAGETTINAVAIEEGRVPDVRGMGLTDALFLLEKSGLRVTHRGSGRVRTQSLAPGYKIANNTRIELVLER